MKEKQTKAPNEVDKYVGIKLRQVRQEKKISQRVLANKVNITFQQIQKYEKGINRISTGTLYDLCSALEVSPAKFLSDFNKQQKVAEKGTSPIVLEIMQQAGELSITLQKKVLQYTKNLVKKQGD